MKIALCENKELEPTLQSRLKRPDGSREKSYGLAQIYLPAHPEVTMEQATDPYYSIDFLVKGIKSGNAGMWACHRLVQ